MPKPCNWCPAASPASADPTISSPANIPSFWRAAPAAMSGMWMETNISICCAPMAPSSWDTARWKWTTPSSPRWKTASASTWRKESRTRWPKRCAGSFRAPSGSFSSRRVRTPRQPPSGPPAHIPTARSSCAAATTAGTTGAWKSKAAFLKSFTRTFTNSTTTTRTDWPALWKSTGTIWPASS